jgi:hypothetical protein
MRKTANNKIHLNPKKFLPMKYPRQLPFSKVFLEKDGCNSLVPDGLAFDE